MSSDSDSDASLDDEHARKRTAELEETYRLQCVEIDQLSAELATVKQNNQVLSYLNCNLKEREGGCVRAVEEKEQRLSEALELVESLKIEVFESENLNSVLKEENEMLMAAMQQLTMKFHQLYEKLTATMQQLKLKFDQLYEENRKIPELMAEVDLLSQQLSHGRVLKEDDVAS